MKKTFTITLDLPLTCPQCGEATGYLFEKEGVCLGCVLDNQAQDRFEANEVVRRFYIGTSDGEAKGAIPYQVDFLRAIEATALSDSAMARPSSPD